MRRFYPWFHGCYRRDLDADRPLDPINLRDAYVAGFVAGGAYALKASAELAPVMPTLDLLNELLGAELASRVAASEEE